MTKFKKNPLAIAMLFAGITSVSFAYAQNIVMTEYVEGSSNNKAIEVFNTSQQAIDLSDYSIELFFNGNTSSGYTIDLNGVLQPNDVFVVANSNASEEILNTANQIKGGGWFNGDDAIVLKKGDVVIDSLGQVGVDPGSEWGSGNTSTKDNTLQRIDLTADTDPFDEFNPETLWLGEPKDTFIGLGNYGDPANEDLPSEDTVQFVKIHDIQGSGSSSPLVDQTVQVEAIVTAVSLDGLKGVFIQEELTDVDTNELTSEGIFIYLTTFDGQISVGDKVLVTGEVKEFKGLTEITNVTSINVIGSGYSTSPASVCSGQLPQDTFLKEFSYSIGDISPLAEWSRSKL